MFKYPQLEHVILAVLRPAVLLITFFLGLTSSLAADRTWIGTSTSAAQSDWGTATNWTPNNIPGSADTVFWSSSLGGGQIITTPNSRSIRGISLSGGIPANWILNASSWYGGSGFTGAKVLTIGTGGIFNTSGFAGVYLGNTLLGANQTWSAHAVNVEAGSTLSMNGRTLSITGNSTIAGAITGTGIINVTGVSRNVFFGDTGGSNPSSTFSGTVVLNQTGGSLTLVNFGNNPIGTAALTLTNGTINHYTAATYANNISLNGGAGNSITFTGSNATWSGAMSTSGATAKNLDFIGTDQIFTGVFSGTTAITVTGSSNGRMLLGGTSANTWSGALTIGTGGNVVLQKTAGVNALSATGTLTVQTNGTLTLGASNQLPNTKGIILAGGTFATGGFSETLGTLTLTADSTINLGNGASIINFAASNAVGWTGGTLLTITNWTGNAAGGGTDRIFFGSAGTSLTASQIAQIRFLNPNGFPTGTYGAALLSTGELVPIFPEASTIWMGVVLITFIVAFECKRRNLWSSWQKNV
jgi:hypothetical protein